MKVVPLKQPADAAKPPSACSTERVDRESATLAKNNARRKKAIPYPHIKVSDNGATPRLEPVHQDLEVGTKLLMEAFGTSSGDFMAGLLTQIANVTGQGKKANEDGINFAVSIVSGISPQDQVEAMLASQMAAVHMATMTFARRLVHVETIPQQDSAERAFNKLARTFAAQVEALKRYRSKGEQRVIVERVTVEKGGQAIVGSVAHGGGGDDERAA